MRNLQILFVALLGFSPLFLLSQPKLLELIPNKVYTQNVIPSAYTQYEMEYKEGDVAEYISVDMPLFNQKKCKTTFGKNKNSGIQSLYVKENNLRF